RPRGGGVVGPGERDLGGGRGLAVGADDEGGALRVLVELEAHGAVAGLGRLPQVRAARCGHGRELLGVDGLVLGGLVVGRLVVCCLVRRTVLRGLGGTILRGLGRVRRGICLGILGALAAGRRRGGQ